MADETISIRSITGVDMTLTVAGPGSRSYAFVIDWHVRALIAAAWLLLARYVFKLDLRADSHDVLLAWLPATIVYFLYHPLLEVLMQGRTPGKRMAGVRTLDRQGGVPTTGALLIRNIFRLVDSAPLLYAIGLATCFCTAQRIRLGDMAAGTLLVVDEVQSARVLSRLERFSAGSPLALDTLELIDQLLERWDAIAPDERGRIARHLLLHLDLSPEADSDAQLRERIEALLPAQTSHA